MPEDTIERLRRQTQMLTWLTVAIVSFVLLVGLTMMVLTMWNTYRLGEQSGDLRAVAVETHDSLCALYNKERKQNRTAREFLDANPAGLTSPSGEVIIGAELLERGIEQRQETITALDQAGLDCDEEVSN